MAKQRYRVEVERIIGHVPFIVEVEGPTRNAEGLLVPGETPEDAATRVLRQLKADPAKAKACFDAHSVNGDGATVVEYLIHRVVLIDPPLVVGGPHRQPPDHDARPTKEEV